VPSAGDVEDSVGAEEARRRRCSRTRCRRGAVPGLLPGSDFLSFNRVTPPVVQLEEPIAGTGKTKVVHRLGTGV
jgi:hypothetical protein